ncbi:MAG: DUF342 domain-containing protein [Myxococcales bacterium]|nr:DUF342 domain-containing protein [Myxococcales bacterium]
MSDEPEKEQSPAPEAAASSAGEKKDKLGGLDSHPAEAIVERLNNDMRATVQVIPPTGTGNHITVEMLKKSIADKKIVHGIDEEALQKIVLEKQYMKPVTVAVGDEPQNGIDAQLVYHFDKFIHRQDTSIDNFNRVDFKELSKIINTEPDEMLLEKIPPTDGTPGRTITGKVIRQVKGKDLRIRAGKGVRMDEAGLKWYSEIAGQVIYRNDQISVENIIELENINSETGNIRFKGTVVVKGIVEDGFVIDSTADVRIMGSVGASQVKALGEIAIVGGVFGKGHAKVESKEGNIYAKFTQDADLRAAKNIFIEEYSRNSTLRAGKSIHVVNENPNRGRILGGNASATEEIHCNNIGGEMEIPTKIMVGVSKEDLDRIAELEGVVEKRFNTLDQLRKSLFFIQREKGRLGGKLDQDREELYQRLLLTMTKMRLTAMNEAIELTALYESVYINKKSHLHIVNQLFPNVEVNIQLASMNVKKAITYATLTNNDGNIDVLPFMDHEHVLAQTDKR